MYDTVLVPTDGSEHAVRAAEHGAYLARAFDATVHLLNVVDVRAEAGLFDAGGIDEGFAERLEAEAEEVIDAARTAVGEGTRVRTATIRDEPSDGIVEYAEDRDADLIAMGTHSRSGVDRYLAGSVTEHVLRVSEVPVLTVSATDGNRPGGGYTDVLVPTDGSEHAAAAVDPALEIAGRVDARLHAVSVVDVARLGASPGSAPVAELQEQLLEEAEGATDAIATRADSAGLDAVTDVCEGSPAEALLAYADEHDVDLIAMATRGRTGLDRYLLGSTTERTVRGAEVPVLAVKAANA